jgi:hypothetical protein
MTERSFWVFSAIILDLSTGFLAPSNECGSAVVSKLEFDGKDAFHGTSVMWIKGSVTRNFMSACPMDNFLP